MPANTNKATAPHPQSLSTARGEKDPRREEGLSLYVHIPFCETKCPYCDFNTYAGIEALVPSYLKALQRELTFGGAALRHPRVNTIFFGGGTPSLLALPQLEALLQALHDSFQVAADAEVTLEANPGDLTLDKLKGYPPLGINRLSIGVQSLDDQLLQVLGRRHTAQEAVAAYQRARQAGLDNINLDFIYGISHQSLETWRQTIAEAVALAPEHLSLYALTLESNTPMEAWVRQGLLPEPDADLAADMYLEAQDQLAQADYDHYEISNWAKPDRQSRHNLTYWRNLPYVGVGPGAHSYLRVAQKPPQVKAEASSETTPEDQQLRPGTTPSPLRGEARLKVEALDEVGGQGEGGQITGYRFSVLRSPKEYIRLTSRLPREPSHKSKHVGARHASPRVEQKSTSDLTQIWLHSLPTLDMVEPIDRDLEMGETMMLGLRLAEGISDHAFKERFGVSLGERYGPVIEELRELGLLQWQEDRLTLTNEGRLLGNEVFQRFLVRVT